MVLSFKWNFRLLKLWRFILWSSGLWHHVTSWVVTNTRGTCSLHLVLHIDNTALYEYLLNWQAAIKCKNKLLRFEFLQWLVFRLVLCVDNMLSCRWIPKIQGNNISIFRVKVSGMGTRPGNASMEIWMWSLRNGWAHNKC